MTATPESVVLAQRRLILARRLQTQRELIIDRVEPSGSGFPRSVTMRVLLWRPALTARLALGLLNALRRR